MGVSVGGLVVWMDEWTDGMGLKVVVWPFGGLAGWKDLWTDGWRNSG